MGLEKYIRKRDFTKTAEPASGKAAVKDKKTTPKLRFVVQRHHASRLHYDFRLEMKGVLKSWAVPKGPSLNPQDKRLAMMVEDHPYDYRTFEGIIPAGNYGAGVVDIFDQGYYEALDQGTEKDLLQGLHAGNLKFRLHGKILKGEFALVKIKTSEENAWLLIKHNDEYAVDKSFSTEDLVSATIKKKGVAFKNEDKSALKSKTKDQTNKSKEYTQKSKDDKSLEKTVAKSPPAGKEDTFQPMLATLSDKIFDDPDWIYEKKLDGYRAVAHTDKKGKVKLISRNAINFTNKYKGVADALKSLKLDAVIDGELVVEDEKGRSAFQNIQNYDPNQENTTLKFYVFDLLSLNGHDIRSMALRKRKELLKTVISDLNQPVIVFNDTLEGSGKKIYEKAGKLGWEGIIAKKGDSTYLSSRRSDSWLKFKFQNTQEVLIIGYSKPDGSRPYFGSLALAMYEGTELTYIGNCGTGFNQKSLKMIYDKMQPLVTKHKPVTAKVHKQPYMTWLRPELVGEVSYSEWTQDQHLRHPVFKGLRMDKEKETVVKENPQNVDETAAPRNDQKEKELAFGRKKIKLTNLDKYYWPKEKITKGQLLEYYESIGQYILPHLKDKPLSLNRHPNGIDEPGFFQKDLDLDKVPSWIKSASLHSDSNDKDIDYLICNDEATLLWMVNLGCIEINPWLSKYKKPENPLYAVLDLDPHDIDFKEVVKVALSAKAILDQMEVKTFIKTSGSKGLHIFIPIGDKYDYDISKDFIHYLGQLLEEQHPDTTSLERSPAKRKGKIYLDFLQNRRGQTIAAPYSARPRAGATVSAPLDWSEVGPDLNLKDYTIFNMPDRLKKKGDLWKELLSSKNNLEIALKKLKIQV